MLTMRSSSVTRMTKPPPPVPPRPSKTIVAEALAKRRRNPEDTNTIPVRSAPPPPVDLTRSQSNCRLNVSLKRPTAYERSISDELKSNSRTIVYQSANMKSASNNNLTRKDSFNKQVTVNSFKINQSDNTCNKKIISDISELNEDVIVTSRNILNSSSDVSVKTSENCIKITQVEGNSLSRKSSESADSSDEITVNSRNVVTCLVPKKEEGSSIQNQLNSLERSGKNSASPTRTLGNSTPDDEKKKRNSFDEKWDEMLKDKNHVNMLIDEMFAGVFEVSKTEEMDKQTCTTTKISADSTTITINGRGNEYESSNTSETNGPTVLIIESSDNQKVESQLKFNGNSLTKIRGSIEKLDMQYDKSNSSTMEKKSVVQNDDKKNAELLIEELESMRIEQERILKRQRHPSQELYDSVNRAECDNEEQMRNCHVNIVNLNAAEKGTALDYERLKAMSSLHGLPPLPKSLSGFNFSEQYANISNPPTPMRTTSMKSQQEASSPSASGHLVYPPHGPNASTSEASSTPKEVQPSNMDTQLAILRREMYSLRQLDLSLLSQLWSLNESIQDFRQILQDQEDYRGMSPSTSPTPSSEDEGDGEEEYYVNVPVLPSPSMKIRPAPPPPPPLRKSSNSSNTSTGV